MSLCPDAEKYFSRTFEVLELLFTSSLTASACFLSCSRAPLLPLIATVPWPPVCNAPLPALACAANTWCTWACSKAWHLTLAARGGQAFVTFAMEVWSFPRSCSAEEKWAAKGARLHPMLDCRVVRFCGFFGSLPSGLGCAPRCGLPRQPPWQLKRKKRILCGSSMSFALEVVLHWHARWSCRVLLESPRS